MGEAVVVPAGELTIFVFRPPYPVAQCVGIRVVTEGERPLMVTSIRVAGVEQLLGEEMPAEFLGSSPLQLDRQLAKDELHVTLQNYGELDTAAVVTVAFVAVEAMKMRKETLH